ncbi:hypothetical protein HPB52_024652 [Rhipicephalus sanguineus]|uniref:LisH domain-containing protein n=1 Tax=Rhipicephalus sanguineus TaxID=34632 RepID=A0A9D4TE11_RHISA|nr:hypothetical protein HPB52_024652 [Rhipicephalus sanguineus]
MDARKELDGLTFKEMRFKMCRFLEEQGVVNDLRARLRYKFVEALTITTQSAQRSSRTLLHQVILWLIQDYLSSQGYEYALCTLACESGVNQEPFSVRDVEELLRLPHCDGHSVLQRIVTRMMSRPETASAQTSVAAMQGKTVHAELEKLQQSVAEAEQRLLALQQQLQSAQGEETHLQTVRHMSVLTELSSVGSNCILAGNTSSSVSSVSSLPLDRARRRLRRLSLQTDYLDDRLRAMGSARDDDQLLPSVS